MRRRQKPKEADALYGLMDPETRLKALGIDLPTAPKPFATYRAATRAGDLVFVAGQGPTADGKILITGRVPDTCSIDKAREAARLSVLNALAVIKAELGSLAKVRQVVQATVWVACADDFADQPTVADGATAILKELWGERGLPARAAVGTNALPRGIPVEVALTVQCEP